MKEKNFSTWQNIYRQPKWLKEFQELLIEFQGETAEKFEAWANRYIHSAGITNTISQKEIESVPSMKELMDYHNHRAAYDLSKQIINLAWVDGTQDSKERRVVYRAWILADAERGDH